MHTYNIYVQIVHTCTYNYHNTYTYYTTATRVWSAEPQGQPRV